MDLVISPGITGETMLIRALFILSLTAPIGCGNFAANSGSVNSLASKQVALGALGDSISRGFDITALLQEDPSESWVTGDALPNSIVNDYRNAFSSLGESVNVNSYNFAVTGDTVLGQASTFAAKAQQLAALNPEVVTVEIGANDVCGGNLAAAGTAAIFQSKIVAALQPLLTSANPPKVIAILSIPNIFALTQNTTLSGNANCTAAWTQLCPNLAVGETVFRAQWNAANQALAQAAASLGSSVVYDGGAVAGATFSMADVSTVDCFHPSVSGQAKIASAVWLGLQGTVGNL